jgi:hypothetical protein
LEDFKPRLGREDDDDEPFNCGVVLLNAPICDKGIKVGRITDSLNYRLKGTAIAVSWR